MWHENIVWYKKNDSAIWCWLSFGVCAQLRNGGQVLEFKAGQVLEWKGWRVLELEAGWAEYTTVKDWLFSTELMYSAVLITDT